MFKALLVAMLLLLSPLFAETVYLDGQVKEKVTIFADDYLYVMGAVRAYDIEYLGANRKKGIIVALATKEQLHALDQIGVRFQLAPESVRSNGPDEEYKTPEEIEALLKEWNRAYPELTELFVIGKSVEGRPIYSLMITNKATNNFSKPAVLFNGMAHAREVMTPEVNLDIIEQLLTRYTVDAKTKFWVDNAKIYVVPMVNVDGNNKVWTENSWWRKNTRGGFGVDLNRNYPYLWGQCNGSSGNQYSDTYRGPAAGSEPETQSMMNFVRAIRPVFDISYHSFSEVVMYPFGCQGKYVWTKELVKPLAEEIARRLGYSVGTGWETMYSTDGGDDDWMYADSNVISFTIELNSDSDGFQPSYNPTRDITVERNRPAWAFLLDRLFLSGVRGHVTAPARNRGQDTRLLVEKLQGPNYVQYDNYKLHQNGGFYLMLNPGQYRLTYQNKKREVTITSQIQNIVL